MGIGLSAGKGSVKSEGIIAIGYEAASFSDNSDQSIFAGFQAGKEAYRSSSSVILGNQAGYQASGKTNSVMIGRGAGYQSTRQTDLAGTDAEVYIGWSAGQSAKVKAGATSANTFIGYQTGGSYKQPSETICIGGAAGNTASGQTQSIFMGKSAGYIAGKSLRLFKYPDSTPAASDGTYYGVAYNKDNIGIG